MLKRADAKLKLTNKVIEGGKVRIMGLTILIHNRTQKNYRIERKRFVGVFP